MDEGCGSVDDPERLAQLKVDMKGVEKQGNQLKKTNSDLAQWKAKQAEREKQKKDAE